jgi:sarcosine oxidase subunit gamma
MSESQQRLIGKGGMTILRESPLHYVTAQAISDNCTNPGVVIVEQAHMGHLNLRGNPQNEMFRQGIADVLGLQLPIEPGCCAGNGQHSLYWLGPTEWLAIVPGGTEATVEAKLRETLTGHFAVTDVSGGQTILNLSGKAVNEVLKKSSVYDFHPSQFTQGRCVQTTFAKASALIHKNADDSFDLVIRRSFSDYLFHWIIDAASEYGIDVKAYSE